MRRRQKADAPETTPAPAAEITEPSVEPSVPAEPTTDTDNAANGAPSEVPETPKRRRMPRRKADPTDDPTDEPTAEASPAVVTAAAPEPEPTAPPAEALPAVGEEPAKPKRAPRRRKTAAPETVEASDTPAPAPETASEPTAALVADETPSATEDATPALPTLKTTEEPAAEPAPETRSRRPRRSRKTAEPTAETPVSVPTAALEAAEDAAAGVVLPAPPTEAPVATVPVSGMVQTSPAPVAEAEAVPSTAPVRTRGLRRAAPAPTPPLPSPPAYVPPAAEEAAPTAEAAPGPIRTRGLRRARRPAVVLAPAEAPLVVPTITTPPVPVGYQPLPDETLARLAEAKVVLRHGYPDLEVNGTPQLPFWFFVNTEDPDARDIAVQQIRLAYEAGVRFFTVLAHLPWKRASGERRGEPLDDALRLVAENAPDGFILPRLIFSPPASWVRAHEGDMTVYPDGEEGDVSLASRAFWEQDAPEALRAAVEQIAQGEYAGRVWGVYLEHGEWFYERGRGADVSSVNTDGYRAWLRTRYKGSLVNLRASWHDGSVTFDNATPPTGAPSEGGLFFSPRQQRHADYNEYLSDLVAQVINRLAKTVKEASANRLAVAVSYGYTLELPRAGSGHLALEQILSAPHVDILTGPYSYSSRTAGGSAPLPAPVDSIHLAGKLWVSEDDTRTYLATDDGEESGNPRIDQSETFAVHSRNFGAALSRGAGISYMDLWGQGWLAERAIWDNLATLKRLGEQVAALRRERTTQAPGPDVAVIVDERSFFGVRADEELLSALVSDQRDALARSGARIGYYLMSDLTNLHFPTSPRLLLFLNAFHLPEAVRIALREKFHGDGRTLAFVYAPGAREENLSELTDALGIQLRLQPWGAKVGTQVLSNVRSPLTDGVQGQRIGDEERINPSLYVADPKAQVLGEYIATGNGSVAVRRHTRYQSVFIGERGLSLPLLRGLFRLAGVPIYTSDDDVAWVDEYILCLHSAPGGGTTIYLPEAAGVADLLTGEVLASNGYGARLAMPPRGTRLLLTAGQDVATRFGIDLATGQPGLAEDERPAVNPPFAPEPTPSATRIRPGDETFLPPVSTISPEDEALFAAALAGEISLDAKESDETVPDDEPVAATAEGASRRKKRRRRGRGRAGEETPDGDATEPGGDADEEAEAEPEPFLPILDAPRQPGRPSLDELLPLSDAPTEGELPPVPDELLPLDGGALTGAETPPEAETPRRTRRGRPRRGRASDTSEETTPELAAELTETVAAEADIAVPQALSDEAADVEGVEPSGVSELTSVGLEPEPASEVTPSGIASPLPTVDDDAPDTVEEAAELLGAPSEPSDESDSTDAPTPDTTPADEPGTDATDAETEESDADTPADEPTPPAPEDAEPIPVERPDVSSGEAIPS